MGDWSTSYDTSFTPRRRRSVTVIPYHFRRHSIIVVRRFGKAKTTVRYRLVAPFSSSFLVNLSVNRNLPYSVIVTRLTLNQLLLVRIQLGQPIYSRVAQQWSGALLKRRLQGRNLPWEPIYETIRQKENSRMPHLWSSYVFKKETSQTSKRKIMLP